MNGSMSIRCKQFIMNREKIKSAFTWDSALIHLACTGLYASKNKCADEDDLLNCKRLLKKKAGFFSNFNSTARTPIAVLLSLSGNPEKVLDEGLFVYHLLKKEFWGSVYLPFTAMIIAQIADSSQYECIASRTKEIYALMKKKHPFLTSSEDSAFCAIMALSSKTNEQLLEDTETCYTLLKSEFFSSNAVQSLCHVLALCDGSPEEKCQKTLELFGRLKASGHSYGTNYELATLGILALSGEQPDDIVRDMSEIDSWLSKQKGFGIFSGITKKQRLMYAGMLAQQEYIDTEAVQVASVSGVVSMVIAQEAAMCATIAASTAAASSASSSSN